MDDPAEQAHFRKIVAAFFFYQVSISSGALLVVSAIGYSDPLCALAGRLRRCGT